MDNQRWVPQLPAHRIVAIYLVFGLLWILASDQLVALIANPDSTSTILQSVKGGAFVFLSGGLIFGLLRYRERQLTKTEHKMETKSQENQVLQRILRHNIRNDLNIITGNIELADEALTDPEASQRLQTAKDTAADLVRISEKVRRLEGIELNETVPESVDIVPFLTEAIEDITRDHPALSINTELPARCIAEAGPSLKYACREVLENSVEHYQGSLETLEITIAVTDSSDHVTIEIQDNGPGIPPGELNALEYGQETSLSHGSGIGLWLVKWVCDQYNGESVFEAEPGGGSTVRLTLQRAEAAALS